MTSRNDAEAPTVRVRNLVRRFGPRTILDGIDFDLQRGEFVALLGRSGSGKSTLLRALASLDHEGEGEGELILPERVSVIFQDARLLPWKRVLDNIVFGLAGPDAAAQGRAALDEVELGGRERSWPGQLSGGEQQRVALARALVRAPELLLADEPFGALDALTRLRMHGLLKRLSVAHSPAVLLVTHDVDEAIALADRIVVLEQGRFVADLPVELSEAERQGTGRAAALRTRLLALLGVGSGGRDYTLLARPAQLHGSAAAAIRTAAKS